MVLFEVLLILIEQHASQSQKMKDSLLSELSSMVYISVSAGRRPTVLIASFPSNVASTGSMHFHAISREDRERTSGPGLRAFGPIADLFGLCEAERIALLGEPSRSTYYRWMKKARECQSLTLPLDTLLRVSAVLGIYKSLAVLFEDENQALIWLRGSHQGTLFTGASPLAYMLDGGHDGLMTVRRYLDAWRSGAMGLGAQEGSFEAVIESDLTFT